MLRASFASVIGKLDPARRSAIVGFLSVGLALGGLSSCKSATEIAQNSAVRVVIVQRLEDFPGLSVSFAAPGFAHTFELKDFKPDTTPNPQLTTPYVAMPASGALSVSVTLVGPEGPWQGEASFALDSGRRWQVQLAFSSPDSDPSFECRGCVDQVSFPIPRGLVPERLKQQADLTGMSLWIVWGREDVS